MAVPVQRYLLLCGLALLLFTVNRCGTTRDDASAHTENVIPPQDTISAEGFAAAGRCISEADHETLRRKVEELQGKLSASTADDSKRLEHVESLTKEKAFCLKKAEDLEKSVQEQLHQLELQSSAFQSSKTKTDSLLQQASESLISCQQDLDQRSKELVASKDHVKAAESIEHTLSQCRLEKSSAQKELASVEEKLRQALTTEVKSQSEIRRLESVIEKTEFNCGKEKRLLDTQLTQFRAELQKARSALSELSTDSYLFSFSQFQKTVAKVAALNKGLALYAFAAVENWLPPSLAYDLQVHYAQLKVGLRELYEFTLKPLVTKTKNYYEYYYYYYRFDVPYLIAYATAMVGFKPAVSKAQQRFIQPFIDSHAALKGVIPESALDQLFALLYFIVIMVVVAALLCFFVKRLVRMVRWCILLPFWIVRGAIDCVCCRWCKRRAPTVVPKSAKKKVLETPIKHQPSLKKAEVKKEKSPARREFADQQLQAIFSATLIVIASLLLKAVCLH